MRSKGLRKSVKLLITGLVITGWIAAYAALPRLSAYDGPFEAKPFGFEANSLPFISRSKLKLLGITIFVLESRENLGPDPGTVFILRNRNDKILWTRLAAPELGVIRLQESSAHWFLPGGWRVTMKPEYTGGGELYVSPWGGFRFFFHRW
jgi:hypothetical protein